MDLPMNYRVCHEDHVFDFLNSAKITTLTLHTAVDQKPVKRFRLEYKSSTGMFSHYLICTYKQRLEDCLMNLFYGKLNAIYS